MSILPEMIAVAKIGGSYEQKGRTREILGRAAKVSKIKTSTADVPSTNHDQGQKAAWTRTDC